MAKKPPRSADSSAPSYAAAGVDLDRDEAFIEEIKQITRPTLRPEILSAIGGFAGLFKAPDRYDDPVFVADVLARKDERWPIDCRRASSLSTKRFASASRSLGRSTKRITRGSSTGT